jgi:hypothetical protein
VFELPLNPAAVPLRLASPVTLSVEAVTASGIPPLGAPSPARLSGLSGYYSPCRPLNPERLGITLYFRLLPSMTLADTILPAIRGNRSQELFHPASWIVE